MAELYEKWERWIFFSVVFTRRKLQPVSDVQCFRTFFMCHRFSFHWKVTATIGQDWDIRAAYPCAHFPLTFMVSLVFTQVRLSSFTSTSLGRSWLTSAPVEVICTHFVRSIRKHFFFNKRCAFRWSHAIDSSQLQFMNRPWAKYYLILQI